MVLAMLEKFLSPQVLLESIHDEPHIAEKVCYAISQLAAGLREAGAAELLSQFFKEIVGALLEAVRLLVSNANLSLRPVCHCNVMQPPQKSA